MIDFENNASNHLELAMFIYGKKFKERFNYISGTIGKKKTVLDVGCGTGSLCRFLKNGCFYVGIDRNQDFIEYAKKNRPNGDFKKADFFNDRSFKSYNSGIKQHYYKKFDAVVLVDVINQITPDYLDNVFKNVSNVAKEKIIISEPFENFVEKGMFSFLKKKYFESSGQFEPYFQNEKDLEDTFRNKIPIEAEKKQVVRDRNFITVTYEL